MIDTIAVDFDGVIHLYSKGWQDGEIYDEPVEDSFDSLRFLMEKYAVFIFTSRPSLPVGRWLREKGGFNCTIDPGPALEFWNTQGSLLITNRKLPALFYIDDRGLRFITWKQTLSHLARYEWRPDDASKS